MADLGLFVRVQAVGTDSAQSELNKIASTAEKYDKINDKASKTTGKLGNEIDSLGRKSNEAGRRAEKLTSEIDKVGKSASQSERALGLFNKAIAGFITVAAVRNTIDLADSYGQISARLRLATESAEEYDIVQKRLLATANATQRPLEEIQNIFIDTGNNLRDMGYSLSEAMSVADSFSYALVRNATDAQKAAAALRAYDVALNKKRVDGMMWQSISSALPSLEVSMSKIFDMPLSKIQQMGFEGKITADMLNEAFLKSYADNKKAAESMGSTVSGVFTEIKNELTVFIGELNESTGATGYLVNALQLVAQNIDVIAKSLAVAGAGGLALYSAKMALATKETVMNGLATLKSEISTRKQNLALISASKAQERKILSDIKAIQANGNLASSYTLLTAKTMDYQRALATTQSLQQTTKSILGGVTAMLGGPMGLISLTASAATAIYMFSNHASDAKKELEKIVEPVDTLIDKFIELDHAQRASTMVKYREEAVKANLAIEESYKDLAKAMAEAVPRNRPLIGKGNVDVGILNELMAELKKVKAEGKDAIKVIERFGREWGVEQKTIDQWIKINAEFSEANKQLRLYQDLLGGISNILNTGEFALFGTASNFVQIDKPELQGALKPDKEYTDQLDEILKKRKEILGISDDDVKIARLLNGEIDDVIQGQEARLLYEQRINEELKEGVARTASIASLMTGLEARVAKKGMNQKQAFLFDLTQLGADDDTIKRAGALFDQLGSSAKGAGNATDVFTNKLGSLNDEVAKLTSLNAELSTVGYESQYNAVSSITFELNSQISTLSNLSAIQKEMLLMKAQELDSQKQLNAILNLKSSYNQQFDDLEFELSLIGKTRKEIESLTFTRTLELKAKAISIGMSKENIRVLGYSMKR